MIVMPILYVQDMAASVAYYERLGLTVDARSRGGGWTELRGSDGAALALHDACATRPDGTVELSLVSDTGLEQLTGQVEIVRGIADEAFGRSLIVRDPSGVELQINEHDRELYV